MNNNEFNFFKFEIVFSTVLISMKIDGKDYQIVWDCHLVEMLNSDGKFVHFYK